MSNGTRDNERSLLHLFHPLFSNDDDDDTNCEDNFIAAIFSHILKREF